MKKSKSSRRHFMKQSAFALSALGLGGLSFRLRPATAGLAGNPKKLLFIFLRGGIDAVQALIPHGDAGIPGQGIKSYAEARPTLAVAPQDSFDLNGFGGLNPNFHSPTDLAGPKLYDIFQGTVDERGQDLALIHRVGYDNQNRSHFLSQQFWENGIPGNVALEEGVLNRYLTAYRNTETPLQGITLNGNQLVLMKGPTTLPVIRSIGDFALPANVGLGRRPNAPGDLLGSGLMGAYNQAGFPIRSYEELTYSTGSTLLDTLEFFEETVSQVPYQPEASAAPFYAQISNRTFASYVQDCARLLKQVDGLQIAGCNQDGYDTHGSQQLRLPPLLRDLGLALTALYHDLKPIWEDTIVFTVSEFGRTSQENGNRGTDHGESTCMALMGGPIQGGLFNCDASTWDHGDLFSTANGRYVAHRTDYRAIYQALLTQHLGDPESKIEEIIPGYTQASANDPNGYFTLPGFMA